jgi:hypothetical protein
MLSIFLLQTGIVLSTTWRSKLTDHMYIGLTVTGPTDEVTRFRDAVRGRDENGEAIIIDFSRLIPIPQGITDPLRPQIQTDHDHVSYSPSWCERNWGASSNALSTELLEDSAGTLSVQFDTVGDFPDAVVVRMVADFPGLAFEGSAFENVEQFYMTFEGRSGNFTWQEGDYREAFGEDEDDDLYTPMTEAA